MKKAKYDGPEDSSPHPVGTDSNEVLPATEAQTEGTQCDDIKTIVDTLTLKDQQIAELSDKFIRLAAEYDNFRRRSQREKDALFTDSVATVSAAWLPVVDNLERAIFVASEFQHEEARKIKAGVEMIIKQAYEAMNTLGIVEIDALCQTFDPNTMEAIMHVEEEDAGENEVVEVFTKGYKRGDKIIRHAIVKVAN